MFSTMLKFTCLLVASAIFVEGLPSLASELAEAAKIGDWNNFNRLLSIPEGGSLTSRLGKTVENLKPDGDNHVYGHSVSTYTQWYNDNGKITVDGEGVEVVNNDGHATRRVFKPKFV